MLCNAIYLIKLVEAAYLVDVREVTHVDECLKNSRTVIIMALTARGIKGVYPMEKPPVIKIKALLRHSG